MQSERSAFTLIELLVVIAIIAILAGVLLPGLSRAKATGEKAGCINNLKQLQTTWKIYADDYNDRFVINGEDDPFSLGVRPIAPSWVNGFMPHDDLNATGPTAATNPAPLLDRRYALFAPYIRTLGTYKCPSDHTLVRMKNASYSRVRSYSMNLYAAYLYVGLRFTGEAWVTAPPFNWDLTPGYFFNSGDLSASDPTKLFTFIDEHPDSIRGPVFFQQVTPDQHWYRLPASRHNGCGVLAFVDGHVESKRWLSPATIVTPTGNQYNGNVPGNQNVDVMWLSARSMAVRP